MLDDLSKSIKAQLYERVSSPLLASFGISWLAWNYRFVMVLASSLPLKEKFSFVDAQIFLTYQQMFLHGSLYPLVSALLLIFVYPIPAKYVYEYWRRRQRELKEIQQRIDDETPLSREEAREIRREALKASLEYDKEIQGKTAEIARLKELIEELQQKAPQKEIQSKTAEIARLKELIEEQQKVPKLPPINVERFSLPVPFAKSDNLDESQLEMLDEVAQSTDGVMRKSLLARSSNDKVLTEYNLGELKQRELVTENYNGARKDFIVRATHSGRTLLVQRRKLKKVLA